MTADEAMRALTAAQALVERTDAAGSAFRVRLNGRDRAILAGYERATRDGWLDDDRMRHAAGLQRSSVGLLEWLLIRAEAQADPTSVIARLLDLLRRAEQGPTHDGSGGEQSQAE